MSKFFLVSVVLISFFCSTFLFSKFVHAHPVDGVITIHMDEKGYDPRNLIISVGDTVVFENVGKKDHWPASNIHPSHTTFPEFDPRKGIKAGDTWKFTFQKAGRWRYHDHLYPQITGIIIVKQSAVTQDKVNIANTSFLDRILSFFKSAFSKTEQSQMVDSHAADSGIQRNDTAISENEGALYSYVKKFGPKQAVQQLASVDKALGKDCHQSAHSLGKFAYEIYGEKAFGSCSAECHSGCYHGATEAFFKEYGTDNLQENLKVICDAASNFFVLHQCLHGVGHGLMAWTDYEIHDALEECDLLLDNRESCYTGVFMENVVGGIVLRESTSLSTGTGKHYTKYLSDDPQYPCTVVAEKYKSSCYFYQSSRMVQLFNYDFAKVSKACAEAPEAYQESCFESMGRDVAGYAYNNPEKSITLCLEAPDGIFRIACIKGAVQNTFWDPSGQDTAIHFCKILTDKNEKDACYHTIIDRAIQVLATKDAKEYFCQKSESGYVASCLLTMKGAIAR